MQNRIHSLVEKFVEDNKYEIKDKIIYLAGPYASDDEEEKARRADILAKVAVALLDFNIVVFSPVTYSIALVEHGAKEGDGWYNFDIALLERCDILLLVALPGFGQSHGVTLEISHANSLKKKIMVLEV